MASPVFSLIYPDTPFLPALAVAMDISPELAVYDAPLASSMPPPVAVVCLLEMLLEDVAVVDPDNIRTLPPSSSSPTPTLIMMLPPCPVFDVHGNVFLPCASPLDILMSPDDPSDDIPVLSVNDPVSPLSPAFDVAITKIDSKVMSYILRRIMITTRISRLTDFSARGRFADT